MKGITANGAWAEYMVSDAAFLVPVPEGVPFEQAAAHMCAGLTIYGSIITANVKKGGSIAIIGCGGLGHIGTQVAKAMGCKVVAVDTKKEALDLTMSFRHKPDICMNPKEDKLEDVLNKLEKICPDENGYRGVDAAILATDQPPSFKTGTELTKKHGTVVLVGQPADGITLSYLDLIFKDLKLVGSLLASVKQGAELMELVEKEDIKVEVKKWKLEEAEEMRQTYLEGKSKGKNVIVL